MLSLLAELGGIIALNILNVTVSAINVNVSNLNIALNILNVTVRAINVSLSILNIAFILLSLIRFIFSIMLSKDSMIRLLF